MTTDTPLELTLCVVVHSPSQPLHRVFSALREQSLPRSDYDVVVVDATGESLPVPADDATHPRVDVVRVDRGAPRGAVLNAGWQAAHGRAVAYLDAGLVPGPNWVEAMARGLRRGRRVVTGQLYPTTESLPQAGPLSYRLWSSRHELALVSAEQFGCLRADIAAVGGWDESRSDSDEADTDLAARLVDAGADPYWARHAVAYYDVEPVDLADMVGDRRRAEVILRVLDDHPRARARLMVAGVFWHRRHAELVLALAGVALAVHDRRALLLGAPWLHERTCLQPRTGGPRRKWFILPGVLAFDLYDVVSMTARRFRPAARG